MSLTHISANQATGYSTILGPSTVFTRSPSAPTVPGCDIYCCTVDGSGNLIIGGDFKTINGIYTPYLARLKKVGSSVVPDATFNTVLTAPVYGVDMFGKYIVISGNFVEMPQHTLAAVTYANYNLAGVTDASQLTHSYGNILRLTPDGIIYGTVVPNGQDSGLYNVKFVDNKNIDGLVRSIQVLTAPTYDTATPPNQTNDDPDVLIAGDFKLIIDEQMYHAGTPGSPQPESVLPKLGSVATIDFDGSDFFTEFQFYNEEVINRVVKSNDGTNDICYVGGKFTNIRGIAVSNFIKLIADDSNNTNIVDTSFTTGFNDAVYGIKVQTDNKILVSGAFTSVTVGGVATTHNYLVRLNTDGTIDTGFAPTINGLVRDIALTADGHIFIVGKFTTVNGATTAGVALLSSDGTTVDTSYSIYEAGATIAPTGPDYTNVLIYSKDLGTGATDGSGVDNPADLDIEGWMLALLQRAYINQSISASSRVMDIVKTQPTATMRGGVTAFAERYTVTFWTTVAPVDPDTV